MMRVGWRRLQFPKILPPLMLVNQTTNT